MGWNRIVQAMVGRWFQIFYAFLSWFGRHMVKPPSVQYLDWLQPPTFGRKLRACRRWLQSILQVQLRCWRPIKGPKGGPLALFQPDGRQPLCWDDREWLRVIWMQPWKCWRPRLGFWWSPMGFMKLGIPYGKLSHNYGTSPFCWMGKST